MSESMSIQDRLLSPRRALADDVADMTESIVQRRRETAATRLSRGCRCKPWRKPTGLPHTAPGCC